MILSSFSKTQDTDTTKPSQNDFSLPSVGLGSPNREVSCLLSAAIVSRRFAQTLLSDPAQAIEMGYQGRKFDISAAERQAIASIEANTLQEFAVGLIGQFMLQETVEGGGI